jgi:anti-anti-sigma factor
MGMSMQRPYQQIAVEQQGAVSCVRLRHTRLDDEGLERLGAELARLVDEEGCRNMVLNLGPEELECLYSLFLAKLIHLQRRLEANGGALALAHVTPYLQELFQVAGLFRLFRFFPDQRTAVHSLR